MERTFTLTDALIPIALTALVVWLYLPSASIPFLYAEREGIPQNRVVNDIDRFYQDMLTPRGFFNRPLSVYSYTLNYYYTEKGNTSETTGEHSPALYHYTNIVIHALNAILVFFLARTFQCSPLLAALLFATHPLGTSVAGQIFGRNYSLALMFVLAAYLLFRSYSLAPIRLHTTRNSILITSACCVLLLFGVLSKQVVVVAPLLFLFDWYHRTELSVREIGQRVVENRLALTLALSAIFMTVALAVAFVVVYAIPLSQTSPVDSLTYFYSQLGNAHHLLRLIFLPFQTAFLHDLYFYKTPWHLEVLFGALLLGTALFISVRYRRAEFALLIGAFLIFLIPTNTFLPKNEVLREWRLYPSLVFFCLLLASLPVSLARLKSSSSTLFSGISITVLYIMIGANILSIQDQLNHYQTRLSTWRQVAEKYPYSADAFNNWGKIEGENENYQVALPLFEKAVELGPKASVYFRNLRIAQRAVGERQKARETERLIEDVERMYGKQTLTVHFKEEL